MARQFRRRLTFANVCSFIALFVALGTGGAYAANTIGSDDIIDESIQSVDIKNGQVRTGDVNDGAITSHKIANATESALLTAPHDPVINQYYLATMGARVATRQMVSSAGLRGF